MYGKIILYDTMKYSTGDSKDMKFEFFHKLKTIQFFQFLITIELT